MTLKELRAKRAQVWEQTKGIMDRAKAGEDVSAEDEASADKGFADIDDFTAQIERLEKDEAWTKRLEETPEDLGITLPDGTPRGEGGDAAKEYSAAFSQWARRGAARLSPKEQEVLQAGMSDDPEVRALAEGTNSAGGYLVPPGFLQRLVERQMLVTSVLPVVNILDTSTGNPLQYPTTDLTGQEGELIGENVAVTELDTSFGTATLSAWLYSSKMTRIPYVLLQDSAFDLDTWLPDKLAERLGRIHNRHFTLGTGTGQPQGVTNAASAVTAASTTAVTFDEIIDLEHSIDPLYRIGARFMFHDNVLQGLRKIKDTTGRYLWSPGVDESTTVTGLQNNINGYPYTINQHMPAPTAGNKSILFGDFVAGYIVRRVKDFTLLRLTERFAEFLQVAFLGFDRMDGKLDDLFAIRALTQHA